MFVFIASIHYKDLKMDIKLSNFVWFIFEVEQGLHSLVVFEEGQRAFGGKRAMRQQPWLRCITILFLYFLTSFSISIAKQARSFMTIVLSSQTLIILLPSLSVDRSIAIVSISKISTHEQGGLDRDWFFAYKMRLEQNKDIKEFRQGMFYLKPSLMIGTPKCHLTVHIKDKRYMQSFEAHFHYFKKKKNYLMINEAFFG